MRLTTATLLACSLAATLSSAALAAKPAKPAPLPELNADQIATAERVLTGKIECEFNQSVDLAAHDKAGYFKLAFKGKTYTLAPEATTTGAVRLEDKKAGIVWIQIANKSMLMNAKAGQRMADACIHPNQKT